jgi:hypothetical protein
LRRWASLLFLRAIALAQVKPEFRKWAEDNGVWLEFRRIRDSLKAAGRTPKQSLEQATAEIQKRVCEREQLVHKDFPDPTEITPKPSAEPIEDLPAGVLKEYTPDGLPLRPRKSEFAEPDKKVDERDTRNWVKQHLDDHASELSPSMCPNSFTWGMLIWARGCDVKGEENRIKFYEKVYGGMKPTKAEMEESRLTASSDDLIELNEQLAKELEDVPA